MTKLYEYRPGVFVRDDEVFDTGEHGWQYQHLDGFGGVWVGAVGQVADFPLVLRNPKLPDPPPERRARGWRQYT